MSSESLNIQIKKYIFIKRVKYLSLAIVMILLIVFAVFETTYTYTGIIKEGEIVDTYLSPSNRKMRPGESTFLARIKFENNNEVSVKVPMRYLNQKGNVFKFKVYKSFFLSRKQYHIVTTQIN